jgi:hypothetical protein
MFISYRLSVFVFCDVFVVKLECLPYHTETYTPDFKAFGLASGFADSVRHKQSIDQLNFVCKFYFNVYLHFSENSSLQLNSDIQI